MILHDLADLEKTLENAPTLAIGNVNTAENGPSKVWPACLPLTPLGQINNYGYDLLVPRERRLGLICSGFPPPRASRFAVALSSRDMVGSCTSWMILNWQP